MHIGKKENIYMEFGKEYKEDDSYFVDIKPGEYNCKIIDVTEKKTKNGKPMLEIRVVLSNKGILKYYLVDDRSDEKKAMMSNQRITKFFDCFKIKRGNFNIKQWKGATGRVYVDYGEALQNGRAYIEIKKILLPLEHKTLPNQKQNIQIKEETPQKKDIQDKNIPEENEIKKDIAEDELLEEKAIEKELIEKGLAEEGPFTEEEEKELGMIFDEGYKEPEIY